MAGPRIPRRVLVAGALAGGGMAYLAVSAARSTLVYYLTVGELLGEGAGGRGRPVRVAGRLVDGTMRHTASLLRFTMSDGTGSLRVEYRGVKPDMLGYASQNAYQDVVAEGRLGDDGVLHATALIVRHGSDFAAAAPGAGP
jgi:cytochrome c-type biogenesis protein CcmE